MPPTVRPRRNFVVRGTRFEVDNHYEVRGALGHGTYGVCASAVDTRTGATVAIKKVSNAFEDATDCRRVLREVSLLRHFNHENILAISDLDTVGRPQPCDLYITTEVMDSDLNSVIRSGQDLTGEHVQWFSYQLLRGLKAIHSAGVLHRDLKPANLLVSRDCCLKICDFGLARGIADKDGNARADADQLTEYVVTRWYRAPELLVACATYDAAVDMWSAGCIVAELIRRIPLLPGRDHLHQLHLVLRMLGAPSSALRDRLAAKGADPAAWEYISSIASGAPDALGSPPSVASLFPQADVGAAKLAEQLLALDPAARPTAARALGSDYFADLSAINDEPDAPPFTFSSPGIEGNGVSVAVLRGLICDEVRKYHPDTPRSLWDEQPTARPRLSLRARALQLQGRAAAALAA